MVAPFLEAFSKPPSQSEPLEQLALLMRFLLISPARTSGPFVFQRGEFPYLYLPRGALTLCFMVGERWRQPCINGCGVMGPSLTKPGQAGKCWSKEQEREKLWILKAGVNCQ